MFTFFELKAINNRNQLRNCIHKLKNRMAAKNYKYLSLLLQLKLIGDTTWMTAKPLKKYTSHEILDGITNENREVFLYIRQEVFPQLLKIVKEKKGSFHDAEELFQEALIVLFKKLRKDKIRLYVNFSTYFIGICKTIHRFKKSEKNIIIDNSDNYLVEEKEIEDLYKESKEFRLYRKYFGELKPRQQEILLASFSGKSYDELYQKFGYKNADVLKTETNRIKKRLMDKITADPEFKKYNGGKNWSL